MIFIFERSDIFDERKLANISTGEPVVIKRVIGGSVKGLFHLYNPRTEEFTSPAMKRGKLAKFLNKFGFCPLEKRRIANPAMPFLEEFSKEFAEEAVRVYKSTPKVICKSQPDPLIGPNCRCVAQPIRCVAQPIKGLLFGGSKIDEVLIDGVVHSDSEDSLNKNSTMSTKEHLDAAKFFGVKQEELHKPCRNNAPDGATHWYKGDAIRSGFWISSKDGFHPAFYDDGKWHLLKKEVKSGDSLIPVSDLPQSYD